MRGSPKNVEGSHLYLSATPRACRKTCEGFLSKSGGACLGSLQRSHFGYTLWALNSPEPRRRVMLHMAHMSISSDLFNKDGLQTTSTIKMYSLATMLRQGLIRGGFDLNS